MDRVYSILATSFPEINCNHHAVCSGLFAMLLAHLLVLPKLAAEADQGFEGESAGLAAIAGGSYSAVADGLDPELKQTKLERLQAKKLKAVEEEDYIAAFKYKTKIDSLTTTSRWSPLRARVFHE